MNLNRYFPSSSKIQAILLDIDETIVTTNAGGINYFNEALAMMLAERDNITPTSALEIITSLQKKSIRGDAFFAAAYLGMSLDELLKRCQAWMINNGFRAYPDAITFVNAAHKAGYRLYTLTNNGVMGILIKLEGAGLAWRGGGSLFEKFYGDDILAGSKEDPRVYKRFLEKENLDGQSVLMVGDNPVQDGINSLAGGIGHAIIVNRKQVATFHTGNDKRLLTVNSLDVLCCPELGPEGLEPPTN